MKKTPEQLRQAARKKLVRLLSRNKLEEVSGLSRPWHADVPTLIANALRDEVWDADTEGEIEAVIKDLLRQARNPSV